MQGREKAEEDGGAYDEDTPNVENGPFSVLPFLSNVQSLHKYLLSAKLEAEANELERAVWYL